MPADPDDIPTATLADGCYLAELHPDASAELGPLQPADERGPRIFARLGRPETERVPAPERDRLATDIREALAR